MFCVIFEVHPRAGQWDAYLGHAGLLRPELLQVEGFIDNIRYASQRRPGWVLSLSSWRDEKSLVRWRSHATHHQVQQQGRATVFEEYALRVGQVTADSRLPPGQVLAEQRLDETESGAGKAVSLIEAGMTGSDLPGGLDGLVGWDEFEALLAPGHLLLLSWRDAAAAEAGEAQLRLPPMARRRRVRVVRAYGMFDRHEAPQYHPPVASARGDAA